MLVLLEANEWPVTSFSSSLSTAPRRGVSLLGMFNMLMLLEASGPVFSLSCPLS